MTKRKEDTIVKDRQKIGRPKKYKVVFFNDDYTPMNLVTSILIEVFNKGLPEAEAIMMRVHKQGKGVAGVYSKEIAETKVSTTRMYARQAGFPLHAEAQEE
tara:strand:+ start:86 stop:388 length:303 start_codon:yes stop_codon:yes gene_type:complete